MRLNTNTWNKIRYSIHSLYYDAILLLLKKERSKAFTLLAPRDGGLMLIVGAGTGLDLPCLSRELEITATDLTPAMLHKLRIRAKRLKMDVNAMVMDGHNLQFEDQSFDYVVLNLILAVIPDPKQCLIEAQRVLKENGKILVFDKFIQSGKKPGILRKLFNVFSGIFFTEINRDFNDILSTSTLKIERSSKSVLNGTFMIYVLTKQ